MTPVVLQYNKNTLIVGLEPFVTRMLASKNDTGDLANLIDSANPDSQFSAYMIMEPVRETIQQNLPPKTRFHLPLINSLTYLNS